MTPPRVSVLIPTYNYARYLDETIGSVLAQTWTDFELLVVDNCSTDNTADVVEPYLSDPRVSYIRNVRNLGLAGNWNRCLELARGSFIKILCADDKMHPLMLERFLAVMDAFPSVVFVSAYNQLFDGRDDVRKQPVSGLVNGMAVRDHLLTEGARNYLYNPSVVLFRRSAAEKSGWFNPALWNMLDKEYYVRLLAFGDCYIVPEVLCYVRSHEASQSTAVGKKKYDNLFEVYRYFRAIRQNAQPVDQHRFKALDALVKRRAMACGALMYRLLPRIYRKENLVLIKKAYAVAAAEAVVLPTLKMFLRRILGK